MSSRRQRVIRMLEDAAEALGQEADHVVFVGGAIVPLLEREEPLDVRLTVDVDCVVSVNRAGYYALLQRLAARGLAPVPEEGALRFSRAEVATSSQVTISKTWWPCWRRTWSSWRRCATRGRRRLGGCGTRSSPC